MYYMHVVYVCVWHGVVICKTGGYAGSVLMCVCVCGGVTHGMWILHIPLLSLGLLQPLFGGAVKDFKKSLLTVLSSSECPYDAEGLNSD